MEPEQQTTQPDMTPVTGGHKKTALVVIGIVVLAAIVTGVVYLIVREKKLTPMEQLQQLDENSRPVTATPEERKTQLDELSKTSRPITTTKEDRLKEHESLNK